LGDRAVVKRGDRRPVDDQLVAGRAAERVEHEVDLRADAEQPSDVDQSANVVPCDGGAMATTRATLLLTAALGDVQRLEAALGVPDDVDLRGSGRREDVVETPAISCAIAGSTPGRDRNGGNSSP